MRRGCQRRAAARACAGIMIMVIMSILIRAIITIIMIIAMSK